MADKLPGLGRRAVSFAGATWRSARAAVEGRAVFVSQETAAARLKVCRSCPSRFGLHCGECGCPLADKAQRATEGCPLGKWEKVNG